MLGHMYATGIGATKSFSNEPLHWFEKAAEQDYAHAQLALGKLYLGGERVVRELRSMPVRLELAKAVFWLRKAAAQGIDEALMNYWQEFQARQTAERIGSLRARAQGGTDVANQAESGVVTGWKGYADMTNTLNQASQQGGQ
jgi:TPR repeat protein